jgi:hypothetical protein
MWLKAGRIKRPDLIILARVLSSSTKSLARGALATDLKTLDPDSLENELWWRDGLSEVCFDPLTDLIIMKLPDGECK